jgi:hypothetical protein
VCPSSFIDRRRVHRIPYTLHESKALKYGHCWVKTSSIGADRGDDVIWINILAGSFVDLFLFIAINHHQQLPDCIWPMSPKNLKSLKMSAWLGDTRILRSDGFISPHETSSVSASIAAHQSNPTRFYLSRTFSASISQSILCFRSVLLHETQVDKIHDKHELLARHPI